MALFFIIKKTGEFVQPSQYYHPAVYLLSDEERDCACRVGIYIPSFLKEDYQCLYNDSAYNNSIYDDRIFLV